VLPETVASRLIGGLVGDKDVESDAFNQQFRVSSPAAKFASDVLNPRQIEALLAAPALPWRIEGSEILTWAEGRLGERPVAGSVPFLAGIVARIPSFVWKDRGYDPGEP